MPRLTGRRLSPPQAAPITDTSDHSPSESKGLKRTLILALGALGVVYGDIGTSPLYTVKECFHGPHAMAITPDNILGVMSLIFWSLTMVVIDQVRHLHLKGRQPRGRRHLRPGRAVSGKRGQAGFRQDGKPARPPGHLRRRPALWRRPHHPGHLRALGGGGSECGHHRRRTFRPAHFLRRHLRASFSSRAREPSVSARSSAPS